MARKIKEFTQVISRLEIERCYGGIDIIGQTYLVMLREIPKAQRLYLRLEEIYDDEEPETEQEAGEEGSQGLRRNP
jgi:hypothetical protein